MRQKRKDPFGPTYTRRVTDCACCGANHGRCTFRLCAEIHVDGRTHEMPCKQNHGQILCMKLTVLGDRHHYADWSDFRPETENPIE